MARASAADASRRTKEFMRSFYCGRMRRFQRARLGCAAKLCPHTEAEREQTKAHHRERNRRRFRHRCRHADVVYSEEIIVIMITEFQRGGRSGCGQIRNYIVEVALDLYIGRS